MIIDDLFENDVEFSMYSNIIGDSTVTTIRIKSAPKFSIVYRDGALCMLKHTDGLVIYVDTLDVTFDGDIVKLEFFLEGTHVGDFICEL